MMRLLISLALAAANAFVTFADVVLRPGGTVEIEGTPLVLKPLLYGNHWGYSGLPFGAKAPDPETGAVGFEMFDKMKSRATGTVTAAATNGGVRIAFEMTVKEAFAGNENGLRAQLDRTAFAGCRWTAGTKSGRIAAPDGKGDDVRGGFTDVSLELPGGTGTLALAFEDPSLFMLQSTRSSVTLRMGRAGGAYKPGDRIAFAFTVRRADGRPLAVRYEGPYAIAAGEDWIPFAYRKDIVAGSALDFSTQGILDAPAGKHGWLKAKGPDFEFEGLPGVAQRFYGANLCSLANYPETKADAETLATRFARLGYNAVRIHHYDKPCSRVGADGRVELIPEMIDRLDAFLAACFRRGIYATTDLYVSRPVTWREVGVDKAGNVDNPKLWFYATEAGWTNWCQFARAFLTHRNPYTGRTYAEEPALPFIVLVNEASFHGSWPKAMELPDLRARWRDWVNAARAKDPAAYPSADPENPPKGGGWWHAGGAGVQMTAAFYAHVEGTFNLRARRFLREELGVKALLTGQNFGPSISPIQEMREETCDYVDTHFYVDHPHFIKRRWAQPSSLVNVNQARLERNVMDDMGYKRLWSKPFTISEYNFSGPGEYRAMGGAFTGAMAAIQGWGALWRFAYSHGLRNISPEGQHPGTFDAGSDALGQSSDRVAMMLYLRRDMPLAPAAVAHDFDAAALSPSAGRAYGAPAWNVSVAWNRRVGASVRGNVPAGVVRFPAPDQTNAVPPFAVEDRPPLRIDRAKGSFVFETPRSAGGFTEGGRFRAGPLGTAVSGAPALVWVTSLDGRPLERSGRMLLSHLTDVQGEGTRYLDRTRKVLLGWGDGRSLARRGQAEVQLAVEDADAFTVWALATDGTRVERVPTSVRDGRLAFRADTRHADGALFHYEITRPSRSSRAPTPNCAR